MSLKLHTIICSIRPGRVAPSAARWFNEFAIRHGRFDAALSICYVGMRARIGVSSKRIYESLL